MEPPLRACGHLNGSADPCDGHRPNREAARCGHACVRTDILRIRRKEREEFPIIRKARAPYDVPDPAGQALARFDVFHKLT